MADRHVEYVRLDDIERAPRNPKAHSSADIKRSIDHHGMGELLLLDERTGRLVAGHGRLDALMELHRDGRRLPGGLKADDDGMWMVPVVRGWESKSDEDAEAYLVASNALTTKGGWDDRDLVEMLGDLQQADVLTLTGYSDDDLAKMIQALDGQDTPPTYGDADTDELGDLQYTVVIECRDELAQQDALSVCHDHGWTARAVTR